MLKEDSVQIPSQRSQIPSFPPDGPVMRPDAPQCLEDLNSSRLHPSGCCGNTPEHSSEFDKKSDFLLRHRYWKTVPFVRTTRQHHAETILDKARRGDEFQPSEPQGETIWTSRKKRPDVVLIMVFTCSRSATVRMLG
jgi:hypothetical protein